MKPIFKSIYGSHLYGSNVSTSDTDIKGVYLPSADEILLSEIPATFTENSNQTNQKNTSEDTDFQLFSLKKFVHDMLGGQTYALELLFSPKESWVEEPDPVWLELVANRDKIVSKNITAMVGYARSQAFKYGEKGKRLSVYQDVVDTLKAAEGAGFLVEDLLEAYASNLNYLINLVHSDFISVHKKENDASGVLYLDVNGVMVPVGATTEYALEVYELRLKEYGSRAKKAKDDKGQDLKALYHAVRIAYQAEELLRTGFITFPRPEAPLLLEIRNGNVSDVEIKNLIDESFERVREAEKTSTLRLHADRDWANQFLKNAHLKVIKDEYFMDEDQILQAFFDITKKVGW